MTPNTGTRPFAVMTALVVAATAFAHRRRQIARKPKYQEAQALLEALGGPSQQPDLAAVAATPGVTEEALRGALPSPPKQ